MTPPVANTSDKATIETPISLPSEVAEDPNLAYFVVFHGDASWIFRPPTSGTLTIGRSEAADLHLESADVSRAHAQLTTVGQRVIVTDLGSQNGTLLNGERLQQPRALVPGDVVELGSCRLVFHSSTGWDRKRAVLPYMNFERRLEEELDRAARYERHIALLSLFFTDAAEASQRVNEVLSKVRTMDVAGAGGHDHELLLLMPELDRADAQATAAKLASSALRVGVSAYPDDGADPQTLIQRARAAARSAVRGSAKTATSTFHAFDVGSKKVVVADPVMLEVYELVRRLAGSHIPVLVHGETGTGKELVAAAVHHWSRRREGPLVTVNCAALPESLVESELFGAEKGAFSGATSTKLGIIESAARGTIVFDEIGELPLGVQAKLLRVLETKRVARIGEVRDREVDIRIVASTNRDLAAECEAGRFRHDLFFRLSGATIWLPPLRERRHDLPVLARALLANACAEANKPLMIVSDAALEVMIGYEWPGNVRELRNCLEYLVATSPGPVVQREQVQRRIAADFPRAARASVTPESADVAVAPPRRASAFRPIEEELKELEVNRMLAALTVAGGNQTVAADLLHMPRRTFVAKMKTHDLRSKMSQ